MSINLKRTIYFSLATLTFLATGTPTIINAAKINQNSSSQQVTKNTQVKKSEATSSSASSSKNQANNSQTANKNEQSKSSSQATQNKTTKKGTKSEASAVTIVSKSKLAKQKYDKILTGKNAIFNKPGSLNDAKVTTSKSAVKKLIKQKATFMSYQVAKTSNGLTYYKIVSLKHSIRGWIYAKGISNAKTNSGSDNSSSKDNSEQQTVDNITSLINDAKNLADQAQSASNNNDNSSATNLMQQANQKISDAQTAVKQIQNASKKDELTLNISQATSNIQKIQDAIQNTTNLSDSNSLNTTNNFISSAYNALNNVKLNMKNTNISQLDTTNQIVLAQNALQNANSIANQINDTTTKTSLLNQIYNATQYMTTLANDAKNLGIDTPTSIPSNDTIRYSLITHYVDKAHFYIDDIRNNQLLNNVANTTRVNNDVNNAKASLQAAYSLMIGLQDSSLNSNANQLISTAIAYIQNNSVMSSSAVNNSTTSSNNLNSVNSSYLNGSHMITN